MFMFIRYEYRLRLGIKISKLILFFSQLALYFIRKQNIGCVSELKISKLILFFSQLALYLCS